MSDLTQFRDHARFMADREHGPDCQPVRSRPAKAHDYRGGKWCGNAEPHDAHEWKSESRFGCEYEPTWKCAGICGGCNPTEVRALWTRLADEVDAYLGQPDEGLFEEGA